MVTAIWASRTMSRVNGRVPTFLLLLFFQHQVNCQCQFAFESVDLCDWTPWSSYSCDGCCSHSSDQTTRTRGVCCATGMDENMCMFTCGINANDTNRSDTKDCSVCVCDQKNNPEAPCVSRHDGGMICYQSKKDVSNCDKECQWLTSGWGQCIRDCNVAAAASFCRILNISLFVLGVIIGGIVIGVISSLFHRRKKNQKTVSPTNDEKYDHSMDGESPRCDNASNKRSYNTHYHGNREETDMWG